MEEMSISKLRCVNRKFYWTLDRDRVWGLNKTHLLGSQIKSLCLYKLISMISSLIFSELKQE